MICPTCHRELPPEFTTCPYCGTKQETRSPAEIQGRAGLTIEERREVLEQEIDRYVRKGFRVVSQTDTTAQLVKPKSFSCLFATLWLLVLIVGLLIYLFYYMSQKDQTVYLSVDDQGRIHRR